MENNNQKFNYGIFSKTNGQPYQPHFEQSQDVKPLLEDIMGQIIKLLWC